MSEAPNTTGPETNDTFTPKTSPESNPFTGDMKTGDFASNFGTNTNAVSQIFNSNFNQENRKKVIMIAAGALLVILAGAALLLSGDDFPEDEALLTDSDEMLDEEFVDDGELLDEEGLGDDELELGDEGDALGELGEEAEGEVGEFAEEGEDGFAEEAPAVEESNQFAGSGTVQLVSPMDGASASYDETAAEPLFQWEGGEGTITFSRSASMQPVLREGRGDGAYRFRHPYPGTWFWQVSTADGSSEVRSFSIMEATRRNIVVQSPQSGGAVAGEGGVVSWQGDQGVTHYRVELRGDSKYLFQTVGTSVGLAGVAPGQYELRVGAFSEVSGQWEYVSPIPVSVQ